MRPPVVDYRRQAPRAKRAVTLRFTALGFLAGLAATAIMALDNLVLWGPGPSMQFCYPLTWSILHLLPFQSFSQLIVLLCGPLLEWVGYGVLVDVVLARIPPKS